MKALLNKLEDFRKFNYCDYSSDNYGAHSICVVLGNRKLYFSYDTIVAFRGYNSKGEYFNCCIKNYWSSTTGKHLNCIEPDHSARIERKAFEKMLNKFMK